MLTELWGKIRNIEKWSSKALPTAHLSLPYNNAGVLQLK
jgi:hypothetical protein